MTGFAPSYEPARHRDAVTAQLEAVLPFWLDRPDEEALDIALAARGAGMGTLWIGELATFDAVALATAVGHRAPGLRLKIGPLAVGVRSPVAIALAASSVFESTISSPFTPGPLLCIQNRVSAAVIRLLRD